MLGTVQEMVRNYEGGKTFRRVFAHACTDFGGCLFADRCASSEPDLVPGYSQVEKLYFER